MHDTMKNLNKTISYYNTNSSSFIGLTQSVQMTEVWNKFTSKLASGALILDFACGSGRDTKYFLEKGFTVDATDGSSELCAAASKFTGVTVKQELFQDWKSEPKYNGIWACSSILHLTKSELKQVIGNIRDALLPSGIFYTSFKYGNFEGERNGRYFTDLTEASFAELINEVTGFEIVEEWITSDVRPGREEEKWLNVILKKI